ncbi:MAG: ribosome maturation factor RimP [Syntrophorhabdaceae bacterium]|nr:ribosome maturation factor RimP [Syntrophorhabdaceae bacterium]
MIEETTELVIEKVKECLMPLINEYGLELVDVEFKTSGRRWLLRVFIDKEGGVVLSDCENISRELSLILDVEDFIKHPYVLEVSSPGLTRPLKTRQDFVRSIGKPCRILTSEKIENKNEFKGKILDVREDEIEIKGKIGVFTIPIYAIKKANLEFEL